MIVLSLEMFVASSKCSLDQTITNIRAKIKIMYEIPLFPEHPSLNRQKQLHIIIKKHIYGTKQ